MFLTSAVLGTYAEFSPPKTDEAVQSVGLGWIPLIANFWAMMKLRIMRNWILSRVLVVLVCAIVPLAGESAESPDEYTLTYYRTQPRQGAPANPIDPYDCFQKNSDGQLSIESTGTYECAGLPNQYFHLFILKTRKGNPILVQELTPIRRLEYKCNCYGFVFLGGEYHLQATQVEKILLDDEWTIVPPQDVKPKDVGIFRDKSGTMIHAVMVEGRDPSGHIVVNSKSGYARPEKGMNPERAGATLERLAKIKVIS